MIMFSDADLGLEVEYYIDSNGEPLTKMDHNIVGTERAFVIGMSRHYVMLGFMAPPLLGKNYPIVQFDPSYHRDMRFLQNFDLHYPFYVFATISYEIHLIFNRTVRMTGTSNWNGSPAIKSYATDAEFFGAVGKGNCRCNIPKQSCTYHKD